MRQYKEGSEKKERKKKRGRKKHEKTPELLGLFRSLLSRASKETPRRFGPLAVIGRASGIWASGHGVRMLIILSLKG